jgi:signal recognition particle subunit SRP54
MGGLAALLDKLPGELAHAARGQAIDDRLLRRVEGIINSMTPEERANPAIIKASRKRRIAAGAGVQVQEVNRLLKQFEDMQKMMKSLRRGGFAKMLRGMKGILPGL